MKTNKPRIAKSFTNAINNTGKNIDISKANTAKVYTREIDEKELEKGAKQDERK